MAKGIQVSSGFDLLSKQHLDTRQGFENVSDMASFPQSSVPNGLITFVKGKHYYYDENNPESPITGKWTLFKGSAASISHADNNAIEQKEDGLYVATFAQQLDDLKDNDGLQNIPLSSVIQIDWDTPPDTTWIELKNEIQILNIDDYKDLAEVIKQNKGSYNYYGGDGTTTFAIPSVNEIISGTGEGVNFATDEEIDELLQPFN